ncbi:MAG: TetR/AcrR family transcriptional regulator [Planctomycetota bacterium]
MQAARALLAKKGISDISMDDIAVAAEYTRRTLYSYVKGRDDIWLRIHVEDMTQRWKLQKLALTEIEGGLARITAWAETHFAFWKENPHSMLVERYWDFHGIERNRVSAEIFDEFEALNNELAAGLREMFKGGIEDGSLRTDLHVDTCISQFVYSLRAVLGRALSSSYSFADFDPDLYVRRYLDQYRRGICSETWRIDS